MDPIHQRFATTDSEFYDDPRRRRSGSPFALPLALDSDDWERVDDGHWVFLSPRGHRLPEQGWKIHLSTTASSAAQLLDLVATYCHRNSIAFKHLRDRSVFFSTNAKDADRSASGKFVTVYPDSPRRLRDVLTRLGELTRDYDGPQILSDLRWSEGPLFVRYGGFRQLFTDVDGALVLAIRTPDGELIPDKRGSSFSVPEWVAVPAFLRPLVDAQKDTTPPPGFPTVTRVLQYSNAGGVYEAIDDGDHVVLKEGRPHAGLTPDGRDAVARIEDEERVINALRDIPGVVRAVRSFEVLGHRFLVTGREAGYSLSTAVVARNPLVRAGSDRTSVRQYRDWALLVSRRVEEVVERVHSAGYTHGDLHPRNFLLRGETDVVLIDFEMARAISNPSSALIGAPGFMPADGRSGFDLDRYAVACIKLFLFVPLTPLIRADPSKARELVHWAKQRFDLPSEWVESVLREIAPGSPAAAVERSSVLDAHIDELAGQLFADATPERPDRLWPGDPTQFAEPAYGLAHGALGPLLALQQAGVLLPTHLVNWAVRSLATSERRPGLMDGLAGAAVAFQRLGLPGVSGDALDQLLDIPLSGMTHHLYGGLPGVGLALLELADVDSELVHRADVIASSLRTAESRWLDSVKGPVSTGAGGLMRGPSGAALFFLALFDRTGARSLLRRAEGAIAADIRACSKAEDGSMQVNEGWRLMPYLGSGAAGVAHALVLLLEREPDSRLRDHLPALTLSAHSELILEPGLLQGRAGLIRYLHDLDGRGLADEPSRMALGRHLALLGLHALQRPQGVGFPGSGLLRRSCDLATGSAGILHTLTGVRSSGLLARAQPFDLPPAAQQTPLWGFEVEGGDRHGIPAFTAGIGAA